MLYQEDPEKLLNSEYPLQTRQQFLPATIEAYNMVKTLTEDKEWISCIGSKDLMFTLMEQLHRSDANAETHFLNRCGMTRGELRLGREDSALALNRGGVHMFVRCSNTSSIFNP